MSIYFLQWLTLVAVFFAACVSPGPDFIVVVRNSLVHSRRAGLFTALGLGLSILIHVSYTVMGIAALIAQSILVFNIIKYLGAAYLVYLGIQALRSRGAGQTAMDHALARNGTEAGLSDWGALRSGFLTNVLNPKATLFFLAVFSQIIGVDTPMGWMVFYGLTCSVIIVAWFGFVAFVLTYAPIRGRFLRITKWIDRTCGALMIGLGIKVALTTK